MNEKLILTIDIGTQSCRCALFNKKGEIIGLAKKTYRPAYFVRRPGGTEQDADFYFNSIVDSIRQLKATTEMYFDNIVGITMDTFRDTAVMLDENFKPLHPCILWLDQRFAKGIKKRPIAHRALFRLIGMKPTIDLNTKKSMSLWYQENVPNLWKKAKHYGNISSYLTYRLIGEFKDSPASIIGHYPLDFKKRQYIKSYYGLTNIYNVPNEMLPELVQPGEILGKITSEFAILTGLKEGIPLYSCGSDKSCESLGVGALEPNVAAVSYGTASTVEVTTSKYYNSEPFLPSYPSCIPNYYNMDVQIYRGYWMINWFLENFCHVDITNADEVKDALYNFEQKINEVPAGCDGLILQPYWQPGLAKPLSKGSIIGFTDTHTSLHLFRSIIEGIGFALKDALEGFEKKTHVKVTKIMISGGGSQRDEICQITANIFNVPVYRVQTYETSSLGAAISGFLSAKEFASPQQAVKEMVHEHDCFKPDEKEVKIYHKIFNKGYKKIYPSLVKIYKGIKED